eukprot:gene8583-10189_t
MVALLSSANKPTISHNTVKSVTKGEDKYTVDVDNFWAPPGFDPEESCVHFTFFSLYDGHGGRGAAEECARSFLSECLIPELTEAARMDPPASGDSRDIDLWWRQHVPQVLQTAFLQMDRKIKVSGETSGATATIAVLSGHVLFVAGVGDSYAVLDTGGQILRLSPDHRCDNNEQEKKRIKECGGEIGMSDRGDGEAIGVLRVWPGGLAITRTIGDIGAQEGGVIAEPEVCEVLLPETGGRLIIASDGLWDGVKVQTAAKTTRGKPAAKAAQELKSQALKKMGKTDDITIIVADFDCTGRGPPPSWKTHPQPSYVQQITPRHNAEKRDIHNPSQFVSKGPLLAWLPRNWTPEMDAPPTPPSVAAPEAPALEPVEAAEPTSEDTAAIEEILQRDRLEEEDDGGEWVDLPVKKRKPPPVKEPEPATKAKEVTDAKAGKGGKGKGGKGGKGGRGKKGGDPLIDDIENMVRQLEASNGEILAETAGSKKGKGKGGRGKGEAREPREGGGKGEGRGKGGKDADGNEVPEGGRKGGKGKGKGEVAEGKGGRGKAGKGGKGRGNKGGSAEESTPMIDGLDDIDGSKASNDLMPLPTIGSIEGGVSGVDCWGSQKPPGVMSAPPTRTPMRPEFRKVGAAARVRAKEAKAGVAAKVKAKEKDGAAKLVIAGKEQREKTPKEKKSKGKGKGKGGAVPETEPQTAAASMADAQASQAAPTAASTPAPQASAQRQGDANGHALPPQPDVAAAQQMPAPQAMPQQPHPSHPAQQGGYPMNAQIHAALQQQQQQQAMMYSTLPQSIIGHLPQVLEREYIHLAPTCLQPMPLLVSRP